MASALPVWFLATAGGILGAIWGSFVVALCARWPKGESIMRGRSRCDHCRETLSARDLVPIASFLALSGRCRLCGQQIANDTIGIELISAAVGALPFLVLSAPQALALAAFGWLLLPLAILDFKHLWLPDRLTVLLAIAGVLIAPLLNAAISMTDRFVGGVTGFVFLETVRRGYRIIRNRDGMGAGDPKLFGAIGLWLGWQMLPVTLLVASSIGVLVATAIRGKATTSLPFGTCLAVAALAVASVSGIVGAGVN
ncbi:MAG: prepilin peptidase [Gammaproteobacteria bacterium]